ncbi:VWFA and cache domain-containing protein 1 [Homalodisca vitripennis]|nr:VWFA and cache domain-containing protein 1 [Homalodisca vitripennis]
MSVSPHHCSQLSMAYATHSLKHQFSTFIDDLYKSKGHTNHSLGFTMAFKAIEESMKNETANALIVYISRGLMSFITEAKTLMEVISQGQDSVIPNVIINTCVLIDDGKTILYEKHFMRVVAQQNFSKYNISNAKSEAGMVVKGTMVSVNSSSNIGAVVRSVLSTPNLQPHSPLHPLKSKPTFLMPTWDVTNKGELVVSISKTVLDKEGNLLGIVGVDIALEDLAEDIIFYNDFRRSYAFFVTTRGKAMVHPLMKQPSNMMYEQPIALDITYFETCKAFARSKNIIFHNISGVMSLQKDRLTYSWQHVPRTPYIVVTVNTISRRKNPVWSTSTVPSSVMAPTVSFAYHRLDLSNTGQYHLCRNFRQLSSLDTGSLFLSGWCFQSPYKHLLSEENISQLNVQSYMAYLKDTTKLLANPGLRSGIRSELISLSAIIPYWKKVYIHSSLSKYIVRKYAVTSSGAVVMYPGGVVNHRLDVMHRNWYMRAIEYPKVTTVTPPYLDSAGAGYVVTLSVAVGQDPVMFVLAVDFTLGAMFNLMVESLPSCSSPLEAVPNNMKCFLMDDRGYLIAHPSLIDPLAKGAADEQHHITHRESLLANDLLNHKI